MKTNNIELNGQTYDIESVEVRDNEIVLKRKQPEPIRWRAEKNERYHFIRMFEQEAVIHYDSETGHRYDYGRYNLGNYFNPNDPTDMAEAQSICDKINALFAARC